MANVMDTTGQVARTMAGTGGVEIKATIPEKQINIALQAYGLRLSDNERVYLFLRYTRPGAARDRGDRAGQTHRRCPA